MMNKGVKWPRKISNGFLHEKSICFSFLFLLVVLSLDCFFQNLPISGYGLVLITLILVTCMTCATCHGIKWAITATKPLAFQKSQNKKLSEFIKKYEDECFEKIFKISLKSFEYPTNLNEQTRLLLKDIEKDYVKTWYSDISQNPSFLFDSHLILEEFFFKIIKKLKSINFKHVLSSILILYLNHIQEYKKAVKKLDKISGGGKTKLELEVGSLCRCFHPGSQNDQVMNYYLRKVTKSILKEFAPHEFSNSLECKILSGVIGRKVLRRLLTTVEDPSWINLKLIYLLDAANHKRLLRGGVYVVKEKVVVEGEGEGEREFRFRKSALLSKSYLSSTLFDSSRGLFEKKEGGEDSQGAGRESLTLPLGSGRGTEEAKGNISTVLSGLISSTAGPLLPDNISVRYQALNKMWQSPVAEVKDFSESMTNSFRKVFLHDPKVLTRSISTESIAEVGGSLKAKEISVGEELCEIIRSEGPNVKKLTKTRSFDGDGLIGGEGSSPGKELPEGQRDVSPVYEEPEDFATTIAKLRSLLQQRESNSTLSDKSNLSLDSQSVGFSMDRSDSSNQSHSLEGDSFDSQTSCDQPADGRLFVNVSIPKGELVAEPGGTQHVLYSIQYDGIYMLRDLQGGSSEPELVLQTTVVKRGFHEFLRLQARLEDNPSFKTLMRGIKGPSKWAGLSFGAKSEDSGTFSRRVILESFLRQLCSKTEFCSSSELHEFLAYGSTGNDTFNKKDAESSVQRIDKLLANKVTGVFNSIKTVLPSFDFESTALVATNDTVRGFQDQKLLQGFLNFGNKSEFFELNLSFSIREPSGESLTDDIRHYFSEKSDCIEDAVDVLDSNDWLSEQRECRFISAEEKCVWHGYKDVVLDDELEVLDSWLPVYSLLLDVICELLQDSESWAIKEPAIRLLKVLSGHWERRFEEELSKLDWDRICGNGIRLLRGVVFQSEGKESADVVEEETKKVLKNVIMGSVPEWVTEFVKPDGVAAAISLFVDSFQHFRVNRDVFLRLLDIFLVHVLSCHHLASA